MSQWKQQKALFVAEQFTVVFNHDARLANTNPNIQTVPRSSQIFLESVCLCMFVFCLMSNQTVISLL